MHPFLSGPKLRVAALAVATAVAAGQPVNLRVEGLTADVAFISEPKPRFSFLHEPIPADSSSSVARNVTQSSYHITIVRTGGAGVTAPEKMWDSGEVESSDCSEIEYAGAALPPFSSYTWTVAYTTNTGYTSKTARSTFETGPMKAGDWGNSTSNGTFLSGQNQFRLEFELPSTPLSGRGYIAAAGCHHLEVNGVVPTPDLKGICPWAVDEKTTTRYQTRLISSGTKGKNVIGIVAGNVMASDVYVLAVFVFDLGNGEIVKVSSASQGWMGTRSYVIDATAWDTTIDWTSQQTGWSTPTFQPDKSWTSASTTSAQDFAPRALGMPLSTVLDEVQPVSVEKVADNMYLYTFPKNFVGTVRVNALASATTGSVIDVLAGEWLAAAAPPPSPLPYARCEEVDEHSTLDLGGCAKGQTISSVEFASFGTPDGSCPHFTVNASCNAPLSQKIVEAACLGKAHCNIDAEVKTFGHDPCPMVKKRLAAIVRCTGDPPGPPPAPPTPPTPSNVFPTISGKRQQHEVHVLRNGNNNDLETLFCWHGYQYVLVTSTGNTGFKGGLHDIVGLEIHTNMTATGFLKFGGPSSDVLNGIQSMLLASQVTNVAAYMPTDCPTREKHGWMGDALDASEECMYNFDSRTVHEAFMQTIQDNQGSSGDVPFVVPAGVPGDDSCHDIAWTAAYPQISNLMYKYFGDRRVLENHWSSLVKYIENLIRHAGSSKTTPGLAVCDQFKDWLCGQHQSCCSNLPAGSSCEVGFEMGGFNYVLALRAMSDIAQVLGHSAESERYASLGVNATQEFHRAFYNAKFHAYGGDNGAVQSLTIPALAIQSAPPEITKELITALGADVANPGQGQPPYTLRVGAVTSKVLLDVLSSNGLHDAALKMASQTAEPSWGWWWTQNATTCWESWPGGLIEGDAGGTHNHIFLCGGIGEWYWKHLVGLTPTSPGFATVQIAPKVRPALGPSSLDADYMSVRGSIQTKWNVLKSGKQVSLAVSLPVGVRSAIVVVPKPFVSDSTQATKAIVTDADGVQIWDGVKLVGSHPGIASALDRPDGVAFQISNGQFTFWSNIAANE